MAQAQQEQVQSQSVPTTILEQESPGSQAFQQQTDSLLKATTERVSSAMMPVKRLTQSTKVLEKLRDSSTQIRTTQTSTSEDLRSALQEEMGNFIQQSRISEIKQKYHSINSLKDSEKIQAVKDTSLNPFLFDNPVDGIANSMSRWAQDAPQFVGHTDGEKLQIASRYYDEALAPLYIKAGAPPLSRDTWLRNAWKTALTYDPSQTYRNPILKGALHGEDSAIAEVMNAARTLTNIASLPIVAREDSIKSGDFTGLIGWHNLYMNMHNRIKEDGVVTGIAKAIEDTGERNPTGGSKWMHDIASQQSFWRDVTPARTFSESATSFVVENAMLLPLFGGIGEATEMGIGLVAKSADGIPIIKNLTQVLGASKVGQHAAKMLTYGTEGMIYHDLTTDTPDKKDAWKTALQFAAMGTLFSGLGKGASKLVDMLPEGAEKDTMNAAEKEAALGAQGKQSATADDYLRQYRVHMASVMAAGGRAATASVVEEALAHVVMEEKAPMDMMDALRFRQDRSDEDPVHWKTVFANMTIIKQFLGEQGWKLSEFKPDDPRWEDLKGFVNTQLDQAAAEMDLHVPQVQEMKGQELLEPYMKTPEGQKEWQQELAKAQEAFKNHPGGAEKAPVVAKAAMLKRRIAAVQKAAEERTVTGPENVKKNQPKVPSMKTAVQRIESRYEYDKTGKVTGYQMGISFNWEVAASDAATAKGGTNTTKFWQAYVDSLVGKTDDDVSAAHAFADDLRTYFNPLKEYGLTFEKANTQGGDWTNFLAFMYSYRKKLPGPVADKLEDILMNSPKMSALLGRKTTTAGIEEFGQAIQNHVDIFTRSDWYKKYGKRNVFRSSQPGISGEDSLSKWQRDKKLIESAHKNDLAKGKEFYPGKSKAMLEARLRYETTLKKLQAQELAVYLKGKPHKVAGLMSKIRETLAQAGEKTEAKIITVPYEGISKGASLVDKTPWLKALKAGNFSSFKIKSGKLVRLVSAQLEDQSQGRILAFNEANNIIGDVDFVKSESGFTPNVWVHKNWRLQGIANAMYDLAEAHGGKIPSVDFKSSARTADGEAFRAARARSRRGN